MPLSKSAKWIPEFVLLGLREGEESVEVDRFDNWWKEFVAAGFLSLLMLREDRKCGHNLVRKATLVVFAKFLPVVCQARWKHYQILED